jgi:hypothetical protein
MLGVDPVEPTEKPLTAASLRWVLLLWLRPSAVLLSALVPAAASVLVLVRGLLTVKIRQPSHEFTFGVGMNFIPYPLVLTPVV